jgi:hypothetical protein
MAGLREREGAHLLAKTAGMRRENGGKRRYVAVSATAAQESAAAFAAPGERRKGKGKSRKLVMTVSPLHWFANRPVYAPVSIIRENRIKKENIWQTICSLFSCQLQVSSFRSQATGCKRRDSILYAFRREAD